MCLFLPYLHNTRPQGRLLYRLVQNKLRGFALIVVAWCKVQILPITKKGRYEFGFTVALVYMHLGACRLVETHSPFGGL